MKKKGCAFLTQPNPGIRIEKMDSLWLFLGRVILILFGLAILFTAVSFGSRLIRDAWREIFKKKDK